MQFPKCLVFKYEPKMYVACDFQINNWYKYFNSRSWFTTIRILLKKYLYRFLMLEKIKKSWKHYFTYLGSILLFLQCSIFIVQFFKINKIVKICIMTCICIFYNMMVNTLMVYQVYWSTNSIPIKYITRYITFN